MEVEEKRIRMRQGVRGPRQRLMEALRSWSSPTWERQQRKIKKGLIEDEIEFLPPRPRWFLSEATLLLTHLRKWGSGFHWGFISWFCHWRSLMWTDDGTSRDNWWLGEVSRVRATSLITVVVSVGSTRLHLFLTLTARGIVLSLVLEILLGGYTNCYHHDPLFKSVWN